MTGNYTRVPLRATDRWTGARLQQGQVLLDGEWNLNLDAAARLAQDTARDVIGWAGVPVGSSAFEVSVTTGPTALHLGAGRIWVDGLEALASTGFGYADQEAVAELPGSGRALVYLDVFPEHLQPAEDPSLVDPALAPVEAGARTRVGWRVRVAATTATSCEAAFGGLSLQPASTGALTVSRATPAAPPDPCDPPGDPLGLLPEGMLRVEVLDRGSASTARFAWSVENGAAAVAATVAGSTVTLVPSAATKYAKDDLVELSWLVRRADRIDHGPLYVVDDVQASAGGQVLVLDRPVTAPPGAAGLCVRRWDGQAVGATAAVAATVRGTDLGLRFAAGAGQFLVGDWWGAWLRSDSADGVELRTAAAPDGNRHAYAPLALVDLAAGSVLSDCRPTFRPLIDLDTGSGVCTVVVHPGDDLQAAADALPGSGGELCLAAGEYLLAGPVVLEKRSRVVVHGVGPATVLRSAGETALRFVGCTDVEVRSLRAEAGVAEAGEPGLGGGLTFLGCSDVRVVDCELSCPDSPGRVQACLFVGRSPTGPSARVRIQGNRCSVGTWQSGIVVTDTDQVVVSANDLRFVPTTRTSDLFVSRSDFLAREVARSIENAALADGAADGELAALVRAYLRREPELLPHYGTRRAAFRAYMVQTMTPEAFKTLDPAAAKLIISLADRIRAGGQGIVVGGSVAELVQVVDNLVVGTVQGIHIGTSGPVAGREAAGEVLLSRNTVHLLVPATYTRDRHAVFVGSARTVHVLDTTATLQRTGRAVLGRGTTPVDAIRLFGSFGPFAVVRGSSLTGFSIGVRWTSIDPSPSPPRRLWKVSETLHTGLSGTVVAASHPPNLPAPVLRLADNVP